MTLPMHALRTKLAAAALGSLLLTGGHAAAKNHDCQTIRLSSALPVLHDRAPGPALRVPN